MTLRPIHVQGRYLVDDLGHIIILRGANKCSLEWNTVGYGMTQDNFNYMASLGMNCVRLPFQEEWWRNNTQGYRALIDSIIAWNESAGMYTILDNHWTNSTEQQLVGTPSNTDSWIQMWMDIAQRYLSKSCLLYDVWNEPHAISATEAVNFPQYSDRQTLTNLQWNAIAQRCVNAIRTVNPTVPIVIEAFPWGNGNVGYLQTNRINDSRILYSLHWYIYQTDIWTGDYSVNGIINWLTALGWKWLLDNNLPWFTGEFGVNLTSANPLAEQDKDWIWLANFYTVMNQWGIGYIPWAWHPFGGGIYGLVMPDWRTVTRQGQMLIDNIRSQL